MEPKFHDDASNLDQLVPFEECIKLHSTAEAVVRAPEYLLLTHNGREFKLVAPITLPPFSYCGYVRVDYEMILFPFLLGRNGESL